MLHSSTIIVVSFAYLCLLFAIAYWGDKRADQGRSIIANPYTYALSIAVYCTSWTFYGSVGRAAEGGIHFLPIYLGPTLMAALWWLVLRKMVRISKVNRITSIADFISSRYGKSQLLGGLVTIIAVIGIMPYISLQLKAVSSTFTVLLNYPDQAATRDVAQLPLLWDTGFYVALVLALFSILFGTRHIDASEHHEGMVAAIAFESVVKLIAFLAVGFAVTFLMFDGFGDIFTRAAENPDLARLFHVGDIGHYGDWIALTLLSMVVIICLPRQFQVAVVENVDERHVRKAVWLFPLYLFLINLFVLPITFAGLLLFPPGQVNPDNFVLALPIAHQMEGIALFAFIGGLSAATGMVIVETIALATMVCNDLVMPVLLRLRWLKLQERKDISGLLLTIRRWTIVIVLFLSYLYVRLIGGSFTLVTIGLVSFCAAAQFAPALIGGIFWKGATQKGAVAGLVAGFLIWLYTLLLPSFARSGWLPETFITDGLFGMALLRPYELLGLTGLDPVTHSLVWSMMANIGCYVMVSLLTQQNAMERIQATLFVDVFRPSGEHGSSRFWRGTATVADLYALVLRFLGRERTERAFRLYAAEHKIDFAKVTQADPDLVNFSERLLAGTIGAASARVMVASVAKGEIVGLHEVMEILDEASHVIAYSQKLEQKSAELEAATAELRAANERLKELDRLKDDFISTVTHELRTPLTSIRSFSEILHDNPDLDAGQRQEFLLIVIRESERLSRLINQVLDLAKIEAGNMQWTFTMIDPREVVHDAANATRQLFKDKRIVLEEKLPPDMPMAWADRDRVMQVIINLLSNAVKFCAEGEGLVQVKLEAGNDGYEICVIDNGPGIPPEAQPTIFEKFQQVGDTLTAKPEGTGLGLAICRSIVHRLGGDIWVRSAPGEGAAFCFFLPYRSPE
ncbi:sensor histidine kinase [Telmatospirillum sp. J64-1]|uniref:sensor histidine kinase n=1 Tax=Telmatospirillum sp. J64-1 TaxID=2502183 RepID=UPI00115EA10C|nr:sensor histidine kinase [Telmatospirillum sp. J64-1]